MSRLPDLEHALIAAAARLDGAAEPVAAPGGLRGRWRRMSRRGHVAGILIGATALGGVATGSAQVAGLHPFSSLQRLERSDAGLRPTGAPNSELQLRASGGSAGKWLVRAYLARNGHLCSTGGAANRDSSSVLCRSTSDIAAAFLASTYPGAAVIDPPITVAGTDRQPRKVVVFGVVRRGAPAPSVVVDGATFAVTMVPGFIHMRVDRSKQGLTPAGQRLISRFPPTIDLRLFAAEVNAPAITAGGLTAGDTAPGRPGAGARVDVTSWKTRSRARRQRDAASRARTALLDRVPIPVRGVSAAVRRAEPAFDRPRTAADIVPARLIDRNLIASRAQRSASRRLDPTGVSNVGPVWVLPGRMNIGAGATADALCIAGPAAVSGCQPLNRGELPGLQAVICSPSLDPQQRLLIGFVPHGVTRATLTFDRGASPQTIAVRDLFAVARQRTDPMIKTVTWLGAGAPRTVPSSFPGNTAPDQCARNKATGLRVLRRVVARGRDTEIVTRQP